VSLIRPGFPAAQLLVPPAPLVYNEDMASHPRRKRALRTGARIQRIVRVMIKYGLSDWVRSLHLDRLVPGVRNILNRHAEHTVAAGAGRWEILRMAIEELGPTYIKLGQLLSNRSDILPAGLVRELAHLQDAVPPVAASEIISTLTEELGRPVEEVFSEFNEEPSASASVAQVHAARLVSGEEVAVKIQRPNVKAVIETDLDIVAYLASLAERYIPAARFLSPSALVSDFRKHLLRELDFTREQRNLQQFRREFGHRTDLMIPAIHEAHTTERLLVMEYVHGRKVSAILAGEDDLGPDDDLNRELIARRGADLMLEQIMIHGFFHADPHPGNVMILPSNVICFLDFGLMGRLHEAERDQLTSAIAGMVRRNGPKVTDALLQLTRCHHTVEYEHLVDDVQELIDEYLDRELRDVNVSELFSELIRLIVGHGIAVPPRLMMVAKALLTTEGVGMNLYPDFTLQPALEAAARKAMMRRLQPEYLARSGSAVAMDYIELLRDLPSEAAAIGRRLRNGQLTIGFRMRGLEPMRHTLDNVGYRLIFGIVLAALMMSSALIIHAKLPPLWNGIPLIGVVGFGLAGVLSLGFLVALAWRLLRRRK
jgi:ubiquinone biosynthesis protein